MVLMLQGRGKTHFSEEISMSSIDVAFQNWYGLKRTTLLKMKEKSTLLWVKLERSFKIFKTISCLCTTNLKSG